MTPQELKNSILQLAIQGKLVNSARKMEQPKNFFSGFRLKISKNTHKECI